MKALVAIYALVVVIVIAFLMFLIATPPPYRPAACSTAGFNPDYTAADRKKCQMARGHKL
jgi:hypothetical protein